MWLPYGIDKTGGLVHIGEVPRGKTALACPYCGADLNARKGRIKAHHFAHTQQTCREVARRDIPTLPYYDRFDLGLSRKALATLHEQWERYGVHGRRVDPNAELHSAECIEHNPYHGRSGGWAFTNLGKIPVGALSLRLFCELQEERMRLKLIRLEGLHEIASDADKQMATTDLRLYQDQYHRVLSATLYLLVIQTDKMTLHKIGVTRRLIEERLAEIKRDLSTFFTSFQVRVVDIWPYRGGVEFYFKHRYRAFSYKQ